MRIPDPIANTTTEAYLAYKAGVLAEGDLEPKLYDPYIHLDAWLAYWAGLTNTYPLDKNNNPECLTDEEALIAYLSGVTDTYPEEFRDPADVRVAAYLKYLVSARWGRPEYPVTNEELYLSMMEAPYIPAGEPSSDIEIDDTAEAPFKDVKMYGNTSQQTYSGKNLLPIQLRLGNQGITASYDANSGLITVGGTPIAEYPQLTITYSLSKPISSGSSITFSAYQFPSNVRNIYIRLYGKSGDTHTDFSLTSSTTSRTFTTSSDVYRVMLILRCSVGTAISGSFGLQLEAGSSASSFEPYVGGVPAPNPDYPQAVQTVTGENVVKICGKNLFDIGSSLSNDYFLTYANGTSISSLVVPDRITGSIANNTITIDSYTTANWTWLSKWVELEKNTDYVLQSVHGQAGVRIVGFNSKDAATAGTQLAYMGANVTTPATFNSGNYKYYAVSIYPVGTGQEVSNTQIELGSTATDYEPYQSQSYPISLGSLELCKIGTYQDYIYKSGDKWYVHKETGKRTYTADDITIAASDTYSNVRYAQFPKGADNKQNGNYTYGDIINFFTHGINMGAVPAGGWNSYISDGLIYNSAMQDNYWCSFSKSTVLATMQEKLDGMVAYYVLATPTDTEITNEALVGQLNALKNGGSYTGTTYIKVSATDPNLPGLLKVEAYKYD